MSQIFSDLDITTSHASGLHVPTDTGFVTDMYYDGSEVQFSNVHLYYLDGSEIPSILGLGCSIEKDLRAFIYNHPVYQDILRDYEPDDYDWHQQWKEDEAMGN